MEQVTSKCQRKHLCLFKAGQVDPNIIFCQHGLVRFLIAATEAERKYGHGTAATPPIAVTFPQGQV
jgi:hypothetical protein